MEADRALADETKHFTAEFIAQMSQEAGVVRLAPFHFSKRYLNCPENVYQEVERHFRGEIVRLAEERVDIASKSA